MSNDRVIVVGAGPVGLTAALALGRRGIATVLLAAEPGLVMELRGSTFHPPTLDLLDEFGVVPRMIDVGLKAPTWQFRDRETGPVATFDLSMLAGDTNHPYRVQCEQWKLMRFLEEELRKLPGSDIRFGHEVTSVRPDDDAVTVAAETASGPVSLTGRYVVAADGARSAVRRSLALDFEGFTYPELFLIASTDFRFEDKLTDIAYVNYIADPLEWLVLLRVPELWRVLVPAPENSDREKLLSDGPLQQVLQRVVARPEPYRIAHRSIYHVHQRVAKCFRHGRVLLAGDAAHINNPLGGDGHERRHPGRVQPVRQARPDMGGRR
jgi:3-(3-hydroxy-phenyl)propionate hydroxylase